MRKLPSGYYVFDNYCTCGGYAWSMNGRDEKNPHMSYCPQKDEYQEWLKVKDEKETVGKG